MLKKISLFFIACGFLFSICHLSVQAKAAPDYEKFGRIAIAVVKEDFPGDEVIDYQYKGREKVTDTDVMDSFSFQVKENNKPITVIVKITHNLNNKRLLNLTVEEMKE